MRAGPTLLPGHLDSAISGFERNPQRLLFGGDTVKQYDGRTRR